MSKYDFGSGHFINMHSLKVEEIEEHATNVRRHPEKYGLKDQDVADKSARRDREELVFAAMDKGWIRVRSDRSGQWVSFQYRSSNEDKAIDAIYYFVNKYNIHKEVDLRINNLKSNKSRKISVDDFYMIYGLNATGKIFDKDGGMTSAEMQKKIAELHSKPASKMTDREKEFRKRLGKGFGSEKKRPKELAPWQMNMLLRTSEGVRPLSERMNLDFVDYSLEDDRINRILGLMEG